MRSSLAGALLIALGVTPAAGQLRPSEPSDETAGFAAEIRALVPSSPCTDIEVEVADNGSPNLSGHVGLEEDKATLLEAASSMLGEPVDGTAIDVLGVDFCRILQVLDLYEASDMGLAVADQGELPTLHDGASLVLDLEVPERLDYLYLAFIQSDGRVGHMGLLPVKEWAGMERVRINTGFGIAPPYGREMVVAVASERPLFSKARPAFEKAESFAPALRAALERVTEGGAPAEVDHFWIWTRP